MKNLLSGPYLFVFITAILSAGAALWASIKQEEEGNANQAALTAKNDKIIKLQNQLLANAEEQVKANEELNAKNEKIIKLQEVQNSKTEEIATLNKRIAELSTEMVNSMTSKDSYCYVDVQFIGRERAIVIVHHQGKYPLHDVRISYRSILVERDMLKHPEKYTKREVIEHATRSNSIIVGDVAPQSSLNVKTIPFNPQDEEAFVFDIMTQNGHWREIMDFKQGDDKRLKQAIHVFSTRLENDKEIINTLYKKVEEGFPHDEIFNKVYK